MVTQNARKCSPMEYSVLRFKCRKILIIICKAADKTYDVLDTSQFIPQVN